MKAWMLLLAAYGSSAAAPKATQEVPTVPAKQAPPTPAKQAPPSPAKQPRVIDPEQEVSVHFSFDRRIADKPPTLTVAVTNGTTAPIPFPTFADPKCFAF